MEDDSTNRSTAPTKAPRSHGTKSIRPTLQPRDLMAGLPELAHVWSARIITLFPEVFPGPLAASLTGKALKDRLWSLDTINLRDFGSGKHRKVDDTPAGGGAGLVLRPDVLGQAIDNAQRGSQGKKLIYLSPRGKPLTQARCADLAQGPGVILLCGRFEGVDQRVIDHYGIEEISVGDYVLTGGELAAMTLIDATVRLLPGVLGNAESIVDESHSAGLLEHPQYTRPADWQGLKIPAVLSSGNHQAVADWRKAQAETLTQTRRPDMWARYSKRKRLGDLPR